MNTATNPEVEGMIEKLVHYRTGADRPHIEKYDKSYVLGVIDDRDQIQLLSHNISETDSKGVDLVDFVKLVLSVIPHKEEQTLYITAGIIDVFKEICETYNLPNLVKGTDILNYVVEEFINKNARADIVPTKLLPEKNNFKKSKQVRDIDLQAPTIYGQSDDKIKRLVKTKVVSDSYHHNNNAIKRGVYGNDYKRLFTLDSLGDHIGVYNTSCVMEKKICPKITGEKREVILLDFAWSNKQQRLGAALMDFSFSFWEAHDNFEFEKNFSTLNLAADFQTNIWYIEFLDSWITTDKSLAINGWDLAKEQRKFQLTTPIIKAAIIDVAPIEVLKLVAISSLDKSISIWDIDKKKCVATMDFTQGGIHSMIYFDTYHMFVTAGYENTVKIWNITPKYLDYSLVGKLIGHTSMITAIEVIEKSPMVVSIDDGGNIKIWDIRNLSCTQTVELGRRSNIHKMIYLDNFNKLAFIGSRVNVIDFEEVKLEKRMITKETVYPVKIEYNANTKEVVVCTAKEVRIYDINTGRLIKIYSQFLAEDEETPDITNFRLINQNREFIIGNMKGVIGLYLYSTGELLRKLNSHPENITNLKIDYTNKLIASASMDGTLYFQKENRKEDKFDIIRFVKNVHFGKEISLLELSVYHNFFLTAHFSTNAVYLYDYEYSKLMSCINLPEGCEPTYITVINGYSILVIADSKGMLHFILIKRKDSSNAEFEYLAYVELEGAVATKMLCELEYTQANPIARLFVSTNRGSLISFNLGQIFEINSVSLLEHSNKRSNYNSERKSGDDFSYSALHVKINQFYLKPKQCTLNLSQKKVFDVQAHRDSITVLSMMASQDKRIISSSQDGYVKVWDFQGNNTAILNINHPLPIKWDVDDEQLNKNRRKILYALKIVENVFRRYSAESMNFDRKQVGINGFLSEISGSPMLKPRSKMTSLTELNPKKKLMKDVYDPRDLQYDKIKGMYQKELQGPSLKQMEQARKLEIAAKQWSSSKLVDGDEIDKFEKAIEEQKERNEFMQFLIGDSNADLPETKYTKKVRELGLQLEAHVRKMRRLNNHRPSSKNMKNPFHLTSLPENNSDKSVDSVESPKLKDKKKSHLAPLDKLDKMPHTTKAQGAPKLSHFKSAEIKIQRPASKVDFFDYATSKLSGDISMMNSLISTKNTTQDSKTFKVYEKSKKQDFKNILKKMDDNLKKSMKYKYSYSQLKKTPEPSQKSMEKISLAISLPPIQSPIHIDKITEINHRGANGTPSESIGLLPSYSILHNYSANNLSHKSFKEELQKFKEDFERTNGITSADLSDYDTIPSNFVDDRLITTEDRGRGTMKGGLFSNFNQLFNSHMGHIKPSSFKIDSLHF